MTKEYVKKHKMWYIRNNTFGGSQILGMGKTKKEAEKDYTESLSFIFSNKKDRKFFSKL